LDSARVPDVTLSSLTQLQETVTFGKITRFSALAKPDLKILWYYI